ncbi:hypothetical protein FOZ61_000889 [Perkinsus olseni]|uniref:Uncharacterized protein n=1 Tax=Perkinsus olseni TaxID=32597 RepID=A0A7J6MGZ6_PEROL|nr:hypothetical protein FOZ61_000889 [Perkinsus olseni]KAF4670460.1 hypothetical protein FOL46_000843 [Perkinsus olseni]
MKDPLVNRKLEMTCPSVGILKHSVDDNLVDEGSVEYRSLGSASTLDSLFFDDQPDEGSFQDCDTGRHVRFPDECPGSKLPLESVHMVPSVKDFTYASTYRPQKYIDPSCGSTCLTALGLLLDCFSGTMDSRPSKIPKSALK